MKQNITITHTMPAMFAGVYVSENSACLADAWKIARNASADYHAARIDINGRTHAVFFNGEVTFIAASALMIASL